MIWKIVRAALGSVKVLVMAGLLGAGSMVVSYSVVYWLAKDSIAEKTVDAALVRQANVLRDFSNELVVLCNDYARRVPVDGTPLSEPTRVWVEKVVRPELQFLQRRMSESSLLDSSESVQLEATVARCAAMARRPGDAVLCAAALREAAATVGMVEAWIATSGVETRLSRSAVSIQFQGE